MKFESTPYSNLINNAAQTLAARTGITNFNTDSKAISILSAMLQENQNLTSSINAVISSLKLQEATGRDLEAIGNLLGVFRVPANRASVNASDSNLEFYVSAGTFGDVNGGDDIEIPIGEIIFLEEKDSTSGKRIEYRLLSSLTLNAEDNSAFCSAEALDVGSESNVSALALNKHSFTDYVLFNTNRLKVKNRYAIVNGRPVQSDESLRFQISRAWIAASRANETALRISANSIPGVKEAKLIKWYNGIGTTGIIVDTFDGRTPSSLLSTIQNRVQDVVSSGEMVYAYTPKYVGLELEFTIKTRLLLNSIEKMKLNTNIINFTRNYIAGFRIGQSFSIEDYFNIMTRNINGIIGIGKKFGVKKAELFAAYNIDSLGQYSKKTIITDVLSLNEDQKIILLDNIVDPIRVTIEKL